MAQVGKLMPNLDQQSTKVLNLTVLQRIDPFVEEILMTAAHVTLYQFNTDINQWSRKDVEGSLFVIKRNTQPRFQFMVMNRRNTDNLVEDLLGDFEYEVQVPYLLYRNTGQEVNGIWFYNSQDCEAVASLFSRILSAYSKVPPKPIVSSNKSEFEELEAVPSLSAIEGPLEPPTSTASTPVPDVHDDSYINFFSAALNVGTAPSASSSTQLPFSSAPVPLPTHSPSVIPSVASVQSSSSIPTSYSPLMPPLTAHESSSGNSNRVTNLVKPSLFTPTSSPLAMPPVSSFIPSAPLHPSVTMQRPYGTTLLQHFPPPNPPASLTPVPNSTSVITRDEVRDVLLRLVQNDTFIDMLHREMTNMRQS